ncbi:hypothetical protein BN946_scf184798.g78, partial [Trametes cinnabarina]
QHGVKFVKYSREALAAKKERELVKLKEYQSLTAEVNPEFYTIWNYRRNILTGGVFPKSSPAQTNEILSNDLSLTTTLLKQHPKVYWIWNHRYWCLRQVPDGPTEADPHGWRQAYWNKELFVVERMLDADPRNFELVKNAMYTDPNDQSVWIYHRWLIGSGEDKDVLDREIASIRELLEEQPDSKWCMESLVFYQRLLLRKHESAFTGEIRSGIERDCLELLNKLQEVDPDRKQRYADLGASSALFDE